MRLNFKQFSTWQQQVFAASLLQRMLPNYALFAKASGFGDAAALENLLDLVWQKLAKGAIKINLEVQLEKLEPIIPEPAQFDLFAAYPAQDVGSGLICLLQSFTEKETLCAEELSLLSINSVETFLQLSYIESQAQSTGETPWKSDPLMEWEEATQCELFQIIRDADETKQTCQAIKLMVTEDRLSNLGIAY